MPCLSCRHGAHAGQCPGVPGSPCSCVIASVVVVEHRPVTCARCEAVIPDGKHAPEECIAYEAAKAPEVAFRVIGEAPPASPLPSPAGRPKGRCCYDAGHDPAFPPEVVAAVQELQQKLLGLERVRDLFVKTFDDPERYALERPTLRALRHTRRGEVEQAQALLAHVLLGGET